VLRDRDVRALPGDRQFVLVKHRVVTAAQEEQILELVRTTNSPRHDVVHVEVARRSTTIHTTRTVIAPIHGSSRRR
jgi:uncharacterized protein YcbX